MRSRIEELCNRPVAGITIPRDLTAQPITLEETLDCMLLTAALEREHAGQMKQAMEAMAFCAPDIADLCKRNLAELRRLPEVQREDPAPLTDNIDLDDRLPEMEAAWTALCDIGDEHPAQAQYLYDGAHFMEEYWTPLTLEE